MEYKIYRPITKEQFEDEGFDHEHWITRQLEISAEQRAMVFLSDVKVEIAREVTPSSNEIVLLIASAEVGYPS